MRSRSSMAAAFLLDLRTPLARISLAAQGMGREAIRPVDHERAASIQDAVNELDARIDQILPLLVDIRSTPHLKSAGEVMVSAAERLRPALEARDIVLRTPETPDFKIDIHPARRLAATLVRTGAAWIAHRGSIEICMLEDESRHGISVHCIQNPSSESPSLRGERDFIDPQDLFEAALHGCAQNWRITNESTNQLRVTAWLSPTAP